MAALDIQTACINTLQTRSTLVNKVIGICSYAAKTHVGFRESFADTFVLTWCAQCDELNFQALVFTKIGHTCQGKLTKEKSLS